VGIVYSGRSANLQRLGSFIIMCGCIYKGRLQTLARMEINGVNCGIVNRVAIGEIEVPVSVYFVFVC
jgi:hypothetical protein